MTDIIEFPIDITKLKKCCKCLIVKDISEFYFGGGPCKLCRSNTYKNKYIKEEPRIYHRIKDGQKVLLTAISGKKTCFSCLVEKDITEFYGKGNKLGSCKTCVLIKNKKQYENKKTKIFPNLN